jgi:methylenetetrahydrofolate reductase (NADPH)
MHVSTKLENAKQAGSVSFSFEFFPPKTAQGIQNLYDRMDRMHSLGPAFIDITWGAGGRLATLTCEMVDTCQSALGLETCMHLTCTDMPKSKLDEALDKAYKAGCTNILALRGDPPREKEKWEATDGGLHYAKDLVKYIREKYGNHFDIGVAGYPEGCEDNEDPEQLMEHLKEKVDAGATFIVTQMFYDIDIFIAWMHRCKAVGITIPIIPGIMPVSTYAAFIRRANWSKCHVPERWMQLLEPVKNDDSEVREIGKQLLVELCQRLLAEGLNHLHFYTFSQMYKLRLGKHFLGDNLLVSNDVMKTSGQSSGGIEIGHTLQELRTGMNSPTVDGVMPDRPLMASLMLTESGSRAQMSIIGRSGENQNQSRMFQISL